MATATGRVDELVKDYLLFRGFTASFRAFETELKTEKEKGLRADRIIEQLQSYVTSYDLSSLYDYWTYLNHRLFSRLEQRYMSSVRKLEVGLLKYYVTYASQTNKTDKVMEFFEKMTTELQNQSEFKDWFTFPFVRNPEENSNFAMYFTKNWQDTYFLSLYNFLSVSCLCTPALLNFDIEHKRMKNLQEDNEHLRKKLLDMDQNTEKQQQNQQKNTTTARGANSMDLVGEEVLVPKRETQKTSPLTGTRAQSQNLAETTKSDKKAVELTQFPVQDTTATSPNKNNTGDSCPFLLLSQEEYSEHRSAISYGRFSNTGHYVATVDVDGVVKVWNWSPAPVTAATLLLGNRAGNIRLFDVKEMKSFYEASADSSYPRIVNLCSNPAGGFFVCSATVNRARTTSLGTEDASTESAVNKIGKLSLWELRTMKVHKILPVEPGPVAVNCCCYNHNGQLLLTGAADGRIRMYDMQQHKCISEWEAHDGEVKSVQFSSDETTCYSMGTDGKLTEWSIHRIGVKQQELPVHEDACLPFLTSSLGGNKEVPRGKLFAFDSEGQYLLTCDKTVGALYKVSKNPDDLKHVMEIKGHRSNITTVDWSPNIDTRICLTGSMDGKVRISTLLSGSSNRI
ncbi:hypothetical protein KUTeg_005117 [Tegillarca granosa]|uniref:WD repeat-containing protein 91 n=1 Tax=Tegillarca granosa TaxID=220873 RepID=A0ABQ9FIU7_TEGGR|nr:hypothetical protein KUTeg_005117 [Tegillarca granosa]